MVFPCGSAGKESAHNVGYTLATISKHISTTSHVSVSYRTLEQRVDICNATSTGSLECILTGILQDNTRICRDSISIVLHLLQCSIAIGSLLYNIYLNTFGDVCGIVEIERCVFDIRNLYITPRSVPPASYT